MIWGANTASMPAVTPTTSVRAQCAWAFAGLSRPAIRAEAAATRMVSGSRVMTVQVSSAEVIWPTLAFSCGSCPARSAERASTGIMALVSAPPTTSS